MAPILEPLGTQDHKKSRKTGTQKKHEKLDAKSIKKGAKKGVLFQGGKVSKITKNPRYRQDGPPGLQNEPPGLKNHQKMNPRASQIT